jgi:hypothetical protein
VPYLKFSRDKRGYEHFSLVEPSSGRRGKSSRPRVLFWFRTPPQIKVGREPFPDEVRRAVEAQNPGLTFDWPRLMATPIPAADAEHWRERRRAEKAARQAMRESGDVEGSTSEEAPDAQVEQAGEVGQVGQVGQTEREVDGDEDGDDSPVDDNGVVPAEGTLSASESHEPASASVPGSGGEPPLAGRRRRRRGRRRRHQTAGSSSGTAGPASGPAESNVPVPPNDEV